MSPATLADRAVRADPALAARVMLLTDGRGPDRIEAPRDAAAIAWRHLAGRETEALLAIALDRRNRVIDTAVLTTGSDGFTIADPKQILRWALTRVRPTSGLVVAHNHTSSDPTPSPQDVEVTKRLCSACAVVGVQLVDHVIVTDGDGFRSLAEAGHVQTEPSASYICADGAS